MKQKQTSITVFFSYAQADQAVRDQLAIHLSQLKRDGLIEEWSDQQVLAGSDRTLEMDQALRRSRIILLLISADFLASDTCYDVEMQQALARHQRGEARVIPIIVRPCDWQDSPFAHLQCLPRNAKPITTWDNQDEAFVTIVKALRKVIAQQPFPSPPLSRLQRQNRTQLLKRVRAVWIKGLLEDSLHHGAWIDLHLQTQPDALDNPWRSQVQELNRSPHVLPVGSSIVEVYDEADGELLILGEPGSGKTTLLLQLAKTLLDRAEVDERLPIPVIFHLSSWVPHQLPLDLWLLKEFWTKYQVPQTIGQYWMDNDQILLLLDGLDEVTKDAVPACVQAINRYQQHQILKKGVAPLVVCCRSQVYQVLPIHVKVQQAVSIQPLTGEQIKRYFQSTKGVFAEFQHALPSDQELSELALSPLMLNIFALAYQGATPEVSFPEGHKMQQRQIFAAYVERMLTRRNAFRRFSKEQVQQWLTFLARQMHHRHQAIFSVEDLQPDWTSGKWKFLHHLTVGLMSGMMFSLVVGLILWLIGGAVSGLVGGAITGVFYGLAYRSEKKIRPVETLTWSWENWLPALICIIVALGCSLVINLIASLGGSLVVVDNGTGPTMLHPGTDPLLRHFNLSLNLLVNSGVVGILIYGVSQVMGMKPLPHHIHLSPNEGIWRSGKHGLILGMFVLLPSGLPLVLSSIRGDLGGSLPALSIDSFMLVLILVLMDILLGLFLGIIGALMFSAGMDAFVCHFILRFWLWRSEQFPWALVAFLDEMADRLLLRKVGGSYIFVHQLLLEHFASLDESTSTEHTSTEEKV